MQNQMWLEDVVSAEPVKSFFVKMLTRDIELVDAILDLLDNCVDGIHRSKKVSHSDLSPFKGYWAKITYDSKSFCIEDNCGGIPKHAFDYAFRMGRPGDKGSSDRGTVGVYGIGMKRAIFKMGRKADIFTKNSDGEFDVQFSPNWFEKDTWELPIKKMKTGLKEMGTKIEISRLESDISETLKARQFHTALYKRIEELYSIIIDKGFSVYLQGSEVRPEEFKLNIASSVESSAPDPYVFQGKIDGVEVYLAVGLRDYIKPPNDDDDASKTPMYASRGAGWTVVCNDRIVLFGDQTEITGWGLGRVPRFHPQFNAIGGLVELYSDDASKLPIKTTKRGLNLESRVYMYVKDKMQEGTKIFTDYTNTWKTSDRRQGHLSSSRSVSLKELKTAMQAKHSQFKKTSSESQLKGQYFKPKMPSAPKLNDEVQISFTRKKIEVATLSTYLFGEPGISPKVVGEKCFDTELRKAKKQ